VLKYKGYTYTFSPYRLEMSEDKYYALGYSEKHGGIGAFRVDRMCEVKESKSKAKPFPADFNISNYFKQTYEMFGGRKVEVTLKCKSELMKVIIDKFGEEVKTKVIDEDWFVAEVEVSVSPTFFGWLFQFTGRMKLTAPEDVIAEYRQMLIKASQTDDLVK